MWMDDTYMPGDLLSFVHDSWMIPRRLVWHPATGHASSMRPLFSLSSCFPIALCLGWSSGVFNGILTIHGVLELVACHQSAHGVYESMTMLPGSLRGHVLDISIASGIR